MSVPNPPGHNEDNDKSDADNEDAFTDDEIRKNEIDDSQKNGRSAERLQQSDAELHQTVGNFEIIQIVIVQANLAGNGNQKGFQYDIELKQHRLTAQQNPARNDNSEKNEYPFSEYEECVANWIILLKYS